MKAHARTFLATVAAAGVFSLSAAVQAADVAAPAKPACGERGQQIRERMQEAMKELNLTPEQKEQLKPIFQAQMEKMKAMRAETSLTPREKMEKVQEMRKEVAPQLKAILTDEQWQKVQKKMEERRARFQNHEGHKAAAPQA